MARALVPLAAGFEEIETATLVDVLRRAGVEVVLAGSEGPGPVRGSRGILFVPDAALSDVLGGEWDLVALPGGMGGTERMLEDERLVRLISDRGARGELVAAICAAPLVLDKARILDRGEWTCYPTLKDRVSTPEWNHQRVVDAGAVVTSQGPATAMAFALHLVERLRGERVRAEVQTALLHVD